MAQCFCFKLEIMNDFCLFEAGGTKTNVLVSEEGEIKKYSLAGFNPNREREPFTQALATIGEQLRNKDVFFYGAGQASTQNSNFTKQLLEKYGTQKVEVHSDLIGAARALFGDDSGVFGIMGTGGITGYYNGVQMSSRRGGHGFLVDDLGGGFDLGQGFLKLWLDGDLETEIEHQLENSLGKTKEDFIDELYQTKNLKLIADMAIEVKKYEMYAPVQQLIQFKMNAFVQLNVLPICDALNSKEFSAVGSIAYFFESQLERALIANKLLLRKVIHRPIDRLFEYHQNQ